MDLNLSLGKIFLRDDVIVISSEKVKGSGDWNFLEYQDTADYEVKKWNKVVKKELIVALKGELYFVKFIINPEEDDGEPGVILGRSFMRLAKGIVDLGNGVITIYLEPDLFEDDYEKTKKSPNDWDQLLDFNFDDVPTFGEELPPLVCKTGKSNRNKKRSMKNLRSFYHDIGPSLSAGGHLTQEEAAKEALAIKISQKFALLEEFISKIARKSRALTKDVLRSLSAPVYCRDLDMTTLRELINSKSRLIPEDPQLGVPKVGIPRPPRASMHDLYDRMGRMKIHQEAIERMKYRQSYH
nr:hypothetical protein [Tanacetum cinerariifolium]